MQHYGAICLENELFFNGAICLENELFFNACFIVLPRQLKNFIWQWCYFAYRQVPQAKAFKVLFQRGPRSSQCGETWLLPIKLLGNLCLPSFLGKQSALRSLCAFSLLFWYGMGFQGISLSDGIFFLNSKFHLLPTSVLYFFWWECLHGYTNLQLEERGKTWRLVVFKGEKKAKMLLCLRFS